MDCFLKHIETPKDPAIRGDFEAVQTHRFDRFILASLSGFQIPPIRTEVQFLVDLMFLFTPDNDQIAICRNAYRNIADFTKNADRHLHRVPCEYSAKEKTSWFNPPLYCADIGCCEYVVDLLQAYWVMRGGNWLFFHWLSSPDAMKETVQILCAECSDIGKMRAELFRGRTFAAITFDDNLFDVFLRSDLNTVAQRLNSLGEQHGVEVRVTWTV